jgi:hypothetical protein
MFIDTRNVAAVSGVRRVFVDLNRRGNCSDSCQGEELELDHDRRRIMG